jgi:UDP-N-acetylglucosamine--N-acetylmuramyl-(pentapeptide) pyrophosphoryl-undecaprenol N-acetylglucosamine transferase
MAAELCGESTRVLLAGGGTGGHVFPGLAVAEELDLLPGANEVLFVGSPGGIEERLVPEAGRSVRLITSVKVRGLAGYIRLPLAMARALRAAGRVLDEFKPDVVVALGGYASLAPALAGRWRKLPLVVLEQNAIPGRVSRLLARFAAEVHATYPESVGMFAGGARVVVSGNPVRRAVIEAGARRAERTGEGKLGLLVTGGSQGAKRLNQIFIEAAGRLGHLADRLRVVHLTGRANYPEVCGLAQGLPLEVEVIAFEKDMAARYAESDMVLSRAGATGLAEMSACGLPALLVPFPQAKDNHQEANARAYEACGGAEVLLEGELTAERLASSIEELVEDGAKRAQMSASMRAGSRPQAGAEIARNIVALAGKDSKQ